MPPSAFDAYLDAIEGDLRQAALPFEPQTYAGLVDMVAYHHGWAGAPSGRGKRVRPLLTVLACQACGADWHGALPAASAVELIHNFSLVHDDIEDHSDTRRGRPTLWARWGLPQALNTGDALFALARLSLHRLTDAGYPPAVILAVQRELDEACLALTRGQHLDMAFESLPVVSRTSYTEMVDGKTAALIAAAVGTGARLAGADAQRLENLTRFGRQLGLAFQMQDDILGIWGDPAVTGKPAGDDLLCRKKSLPTLLGLERSHRFRELWASDPLDAPALQAMRVELESCGAQGATIEAAAEHTRQALEALRGASPADPAGALLRDLALQMLGRQR
jgi:geranylgeranyl diphosphate synthase type I